MPLGAYRLNGLARFVKTGRSAIVLTTNGDAQVDTAQSKFGGASALFDGVNDYIQSGNEDVLNTGTGDWTYECWFRPAALATSNILIDNRNSTSNTQANNRGIFRLRLSQINFSDGATNLNGTTTLSTNTWYHYACTHSGGTVKIYLNGTLENTGTYSSLNFSANHRITIGTAYSAADDFNGHIDEVRISNTVRYTGNFTPSTTPFVNDENTLLLLHMDGTDASTFFEDDNGVRSKQGVSAIGNAQIDTAQSKFGGSSYLGDGSSDNLSIPDLRIPQTGNFTLECWFRPANTGERFDLIATNTTGEGRTFCNTTTSNQIQAFIGTTVGNLLLTSTTTYSANTWYHYAFVRNGNNYYLFLDGNLEASETVGTNRSIAQVAVLIGARPSFGNDAMNGHIDEVRISNTARYTANFTPSTTPFQNDSNTLLLLHMDGTDASTVFTDDNS